MWTQDRFKSWDGTEIFYRFYALRGAQQTLVLLHGYGEHSGRYEKFPQRLKGISSQIAIMDFRGMGHSGGVRGDADALEDYLRDVSAFINLLRDKHGISNQFILFGHSLGGLVAVYWAMQNPEPIRMMILSAPLLGLRFSGLIHFVSRFFGLLSPQFFFLTPRNLKALSRDPEEVALFRDDPLVLRRISARLLLGIVKGMKSLRRQRCQKFPFPVYLLCAGEDQIINSKDVAVFFDRLVAPKKDRIVFEGFCHEIFNEIDQQKAFDVLRATIEN